MRSLVKTCHLMILFMITMAIVCPAHSAFSYEREIANLSSILAADIAKSGKKSIAVVDFTDLQGHVNELGRFLAEEMSGNMTSQSQGFDVLDRNHIKRILEEQNLSLSGLVDPTTIKKIGKLTGTDIIITGTITPFGDSIRVACKAIETETGKVISSSRGDIAKTATIADLLKLGVGSPAASAGDTKDTATKAPITGTGWSGTWNTDWGKMTLNEQGNHVTGTYTFKNGRIDGTVSGGVLSGKWTQSNGSGRFEFTMSDDGRTFNGIWGYGEGLDNGIWKGTRR
jgi:TolB-like protein